MTSPPSKDRTAYAHFVCKGVLTRMALIFTASGNKLFTGDQVTEILLAAVQSIEEFKEEKPVKILEAVNDNIH